MELDQSLFLLFSTLLLVAFLDQSIGFIWKIIKNEKYG
jgi:hypothetical protein